jgi:hypothetical protein
LLCGAGLAVVAALAALAYETHGRSVKHVASGPRAPDEVAKLQREVAELRRESAQLRGLTYYVAQNVGQTPHVSGASDPSEQAVGAKEQASSEAYLEYVSSAFNRETAHPTWNPTSELRDKVNGVLPEGSSLRSLSCRTSMCRMETSHRDARTYGDFTRSLVMQGDGGSVWAGPAFFEMIREPTGAGDELVAVAYLGRESLPFIPAHQ